VTAVDRVVAVLHQQVGLDAGVVDAREFFRAGARRTASSCGSGRRCQRS